MKKLLGLFLASVMAFSLVGCSGNNQNTEKEDVSTEAGSTEDTSEKKIIKIVWCDDTQDSTRAKMLDICRNRVEEINSERDDIELQLTYYDAQKSVDQQISNVEAAVLTDPDVFIFSCVDSKGSLPCLQIMKDSGAKIIDIRDMGSDLTDVVFYGSDEATYKMAVQDWVRKYVNDNPDKELKVGLIYGAAAQTLQLVRCDLMKELANEMPDRIEIIAEAYGDWDTQRAMGIMEDWIQAYPEMNFVCSANDIMALGASNALVSAGVKDKVTLTGIDLDGGAELIAEGKQDLDVGASIEDNKVLMDISVALAEGTWDKGKTYTLDAVMRVDASNVQEYLSGNYEACRFSADN